MRELTMQCKPEACTGNMRIMTTVNQNLVKTWSKPVKCRTETYKTSQRMTE